MYSSIPATETPCVCTTVKKVSRVLGRVYDASLGESGINVTQLAVLRCIARRAGDPLARTADELEMDRTSLYRAIDPMVRDGWLQPMKGAAGRGRRVELTRLGQAVLKRANKRWGEVQERVIGRFGETAYEALLLELNRLADATLPRD